MLDLSGLQVIAITVYFLLSIAFYAFFAPFLGQDLYEDVATGVYSLLVRLLPRELKNHSSFPHPSLIILANLCLALE